MNVLNSSDYEVIMNDIDVVVIVPAQACSTTKAYIELASLEVM